MAFIGSFMGPFFGGLAFASDGPSGLFTLYTGSAILRLLISAGLFYAHRTPRTAHRAPASHPLEEAIPVLVEN